MNKFLILLSVTVLAACNGFRSIKTAFKDRSPYETYVESLKKAELLNASMTQEWLQASEAVFLDSVFVNVPHSESGFFQASSPEARSFRFNVKDGQVLTVNGLVKTQGDANVFLDLFIRSGAEWDHIAYGDSTLSITHEFGTDEECVLRIQPELLVNAWFSVTISLTPVLLNPVFGASNRSIGSFYGASRDNGKRSHEGVDIFAPRGTPVVAPTDGYISRVGTNTLGGKVIWMKDARRGHSYYFAHLDSQMVRPGMRVRQGHVLGLVGNTGNAKRTPPHLHFGVYQSGSKDPLHYIRKLEAGIKSMPVDTGFNQKPFKIARKRADMRTGPSDALPLKTSLQRDTYVTVIGQTNDWYRVVLPDHVQGFVMKKHVAPLAPGKAAILDSTATLLSTTGRDALPVAMLPQNTSVEILARFADFNFIITPDGKAGWLARSADSRI